MSEYRFSGLYYSPPDRGDPDGTETPFVEKFRAKDDEAARTWVKQFKSNRTEIRAPRLERIDQPEVTSIIKL